MNIGQAVKQLRKSKKIRQECLAKMIGISPTSLVSIEKGYTFPHKSTIKSICDALDIPPAYLLLFSIEDADIPENSRKTFNILANTLKNLLLEKE